MELLILVFCIFLLIGSIKAFGNSTRIKLQQETIRELAFNGAEVLIRI